MITTQGQETASKLIQKYYENMLQEDSIAKIKENLEQELDNIKNVVGFIEKDVIKYNLIRNIIQFLGNKDISSILTVLIHSYKIDEDKDKLIEMAREHLHVSDLCKAIYSIKWERARYLSIKKNINYLFSDADIAREYHIGANLIKSFSDFDTIIKMLKSDSILNAFDSETIEGAFYKLNFEFETGLDSESPISSERFSLGVLDVIYNPIILKKISYEFLNKEIKKFQIPEFHAESILNIKASIDINKKNTLGRIKTMKENVTVT